MHTVLWKRLDQEGHDACRFIETDSGWTVEGTAVFDHDGVVANLAYHVTSTREWEGRTAFVSGWIGSNSFHLHIEREGEDTWRVTGCVRENLTGLKDIDLGFTPATNTSAIRRLNLVIGAEGKSEAVWLDTEDWAVKPLAQSYRRIGKAAYDYSSPQHSYRAVLLVDSFDAVTEYPGLWMRMGTGSVGS